MVAPVSTEADTNPRISSIDEQSACRIWKASDWRDLFVVGFLVTEPGDIDRPLALALCDDTVAGDEEEHRAFDVAREIAKDYSAVNRVRGGGAVISLGDYGHPDSRSPMPAFVYSLRCVPMYTVGDEEYPNVIDVPPVEPRPFCRFRMADMIERHNQIHFTAQEKQEYPYAIVSLSDREDGNGASVFRPVAPLLTVPVYQSTLDRLAKAAEVNGPMYETIDGVVDVYDVMIEERRAASKAKKARG